MRISDWSSDVCSSDLHGAEHHDAEIALTHHELYGMDRIERCEDAEVVRDVDQAAQAHDDEPRGGDRPEEARDVLGPLGMDGEQERQYGNGDRNDHRFSGGRRSEEHTSELQSLMSISYAVL